MDPGVSQRLLLALAVSLALHLSLLYTVKVVPALRPAASALRAQLKPNAVQPKPSADAPPRVTRRVHVPRAADTTRPTPVEQSAAAVASAPAELTPTVSDAPAPLPALDTTWYPARQLDVYPQPMSMPQPAYPEQASVAGVHGEVTLLVLVDEAGVVHEVSVVEAQPEGYFEAAAVAAFQDVRFEPARKDGRPVRSRVLVKVAFSPSEE